MIAYRDSGNKNRGKAIVGTVSGTSISFGSEFTFEYGATSYISAVYDSTNNKVVISYTDGGDPSDIKGRAIVGTVSGTSITYGSDTLFHNGYVFDPSAIFDSTNGKVVIAYRNSNNSHYGTAIVGEVNPGTNAITFGSPVVFNSNGRIEPISAVFDSSTGKVVLSYRDHNNGQYGTVSVGTVSGTSISFDTPVVYNAAASDRNTSVYDPVSQKVVIAYQDDGNSQKGTGVVFSLAGQSIPQLGSAAVFEYGDSRFISSTYDSYNNKVVIVYRDNGNSFYGTAVVGEVSGTSISFGSPVVFESAATLYTSATFDSTNNKVVIAYQDVGNSSYGTAIVGTVSGTSISFGTPVVFNTANTSEPSVIYDTTSERIVISYQDTGNSDLGTAIVGTVSGTSISFGTPVVYHNAHTSYISSTYDSTNQKVVVAYKDGANSNYGTAVVGTVSGTSISFGTPVVFHSGTTGTFTSSAFDPTSGKVVITYTDQDNSAYGTAIVGTVSGTGISFGSEVIFNTGTVTYKSAIYDSLAQKVVIAYRTYNGSSTVGEVITGTVSGTSISLSTPTVLNSADSQYVQAVYDSTNQKVITAYQDQSSSNYGTAIVFSPVTMGTNLTTENYIGISDGAFTNGQTATIQLIGSVDDAQSGLTPGQKYYIQGNGTLSETADDPSVFAGTAVSSTSLVVKS